MSDSYKHDADYSGKSPHQIFTGAEKIAFGERLKQAIGNESVLSFAKKCGLSDTLIGKYIKGISYPGIDKLPQIAKASGKSISWFFEDDTQTPSLAEQSPNPEELQEWWGIISKSMTLNELSAAVESFKRGGKDALFAQLMEDRPQVSQSALNTALILEALPDAERREILEKYGITEQGSPVAPGEEPHKRAV